MNQNITYGIVGLLSALLASAGVVVFTPDQIDNTYICSVSQKVGVFERLSSTSKTGYWTDGTGSHSSICTNGVWIPIKQYAKDNNIDISILLEQSAAEDISSDLRPQSGGLQYRCNSEKCEVLE